MTIIETYRDFDIIDQDGEILTRGTGDFESDCGGPYTDVAAARADIDSFHNQVEEWANP